MNNKGTYNKIGPYINGTTSTQVLVFLFLYINISGRKREWNLGEVEEGVENGHWSSSWDDAPVRPGWKPSDERNWGRAEAISSQLQLCSAQLERCLLFCLFSFEEYIFLQEEGLEWLFLIHGKFPILFSIFFSWWVFG